MDAPTLGTQAAAPFGPALVRGHWARSLAAHMLDAGLTRKALRHRLEGVGVRVTEQAIGCWLRAETAPRPHHQAALAMVLEVPPPALFPLPPVGPAAR